MLLSRSTLARLQSVTAPTLAWLSVLALAAWLGAFWFWRFSAPAVAGGVYAASSDPGNAANEISSRHLFGAQSSQQATEPTAAVVAVDVRVLGVMTGAARSPGFAVIQEEGKTSRSVIEGEELRPGVKLEKVLPQGIEVSQSGRREFWALSNNQGNAVPPVPVQVTSPPPPPLAVASSPSAIPSHSGLSGKGFISRDGEPKPAENSSND